MTDTKVDPWALLREMRGRMMDHGDDYAVQRIDAALAAHEAEERVEVNWIPNGPRGFSGYLKNRIEKASTYQTKGGLWWAAATDIGPFATLDEAKSAAIEAARGMR